MAAWMRWWWTAAVLTVLPIHSPLLCIGSGVPGTHTPLHTGREDNHGYEEVTVPLNPQGDEHATRDGMVGGVDGGGKGVHRSELPARLSESDVESAVAWRVLQTQVEPVKTSGEGAWRVPQARAVPLSPSAYQGVSPSPSPADFPNLPGSTAGEGDANTPSTAAAVAGASSAQHVGGRGKVGVDQGPAATAALEQRRRRRLIQEDHARAAATLQRRRRLDYPGIVTALNGTQTYEVFNPNASTAYSEAGKCVLWSHRSCPATHLAPSFRASSANPTWPHTLF